MQRVTMSFCLLLCVVGRVFAVEQPVRATVHQLLATPEKFAGKRVDVTGYYMSGTETSDLYASERVSGRKFDDAIWIEVDFPGSRRPASVAKLAFFWTGTVRVIGTFHYQPRPVLGADVPYVKRFQGFGCYRLYKRAISDITYLQRE